MEQNREPKNKSTMTKEPRLHKGVKTVSSINGAGKTGQPQAKG